VLTFIFGYEAVFPDIERPTLEHTSIVDFRTMKCDSDSSLQQGWEGFHSFVSSSYDHPPFMFQEFAPEAEGQIVCVPPLLDPDYPS
jgi:hypothetical protein